jgi:hypothetical protein
MALHEVQSNDGMDLLALGGVNASNEGKIVALVEKPLFPTPNFSPTHLAGFLK